MKVPVLCVPQQLSAGKVGEDRLEVTLALPGQGPWSIPAASELQPWERSF